MVNTTHYPGSTLQDTLVQGGDAENFSNVTLDASLNASMQGFVSMHKTGRSLQLVVSLICIALNTIIMKALPKWKSLFPSTKVFIFNLAVADIVSSSVVFLRSAIRLSNNDTITRFGCILLSNLFTSSVLASQSIILILSVNNLFAISTKAKMFKKKYAIVLAASVWCFWFVCFTLYLIVSAVFETDILEGKCMPKLGFILVCFAAVTQSLVISFTNVFTLVKINSEIKSLLLLGNQGYFRMKHLKTIKKTSTFTALIIVLLFVSVMPYIIVSWIFIDRDEQFGSIVVPLLMLNNVSNIFIYAAKSKEFRYAVKQVFGVQNTINVIA